MAPRAEHMVCVMLQSDDWTARPVRLRSFGGKSVGFPSPVSLTMTLLNYPDSSPRLELKVMVPKDLSTPTTYFGPKMEPPSASLNHHINIRLEAQSIRSLRWRRFATSELHLPADAVKKGDQWTVFEFAVQSPAVQGWPMPFEPQDPEADKWFQQGAKLENLTSTMAQLLGSNGIITVATPTKPKHPRVPDIQAALDRSPFAYFDYGSYAPDRDVDQFKDKIRQHRDTAKETSSYSPVIAYPTASQAAIAMEQGVVQDILDVHVHVKEIRQGTVPVRFIRKAPNREDRYWAIVRFTAAFKRYFETSLPRLKREDDNKPDDDVWPCKIVMRQTGFDHFGDLVLDCRRPDSRDPAKSSTRQKKVKAVDSWIEGENDAVQEMVHLAFSKQDVTAIPRIAAVERVFNLGSIANTNTAVKANPAIFGSRLPGAEVKLAHRAFASMGELAAALKQAGALKPTKEQEMKLQQNMHSRALQRDPIRQISFLGRHRGTLQRAILDRVHDKDRATFMDVLSKVPLGILPIVGFAGSGKTDLMATTVLLAVGVGPVIVCTPTHAAASNIAARVTKLAGLAYEKAKEPMPVVIRGFSWKVDELQAKTRALNQGPVDASHDHWEQSLSMLNWIQNVFWPGNLTSGSMKPAFHQLVKDVEKETKLMHLKDTPQNQKGWTAAHSQSFKELAVRILKVADVVCCTTYASTMDILADWTRNTAKSTFLDDANAMSMPEALVPWFDGRPLVLTGDFRQVPPCVMTMGQKSSTGGPLNFFDKHQEISVLERLMRMQWPCWNSQRQNRIVNGGFDLARDIFYPDLGDKFEYGDQCAVSKRPGAIQVEAWVRRHFPNIKASPTGKVLPAFINCTLCVNHGQAEIALALMERLSKSQATKFVVVSPHMATKTHLEGLIRANESARSNIQVSTADSFQGKEADVAIFLTTVTQESGGPVVCQGAAPVNVGITRHADFLFVIGDINAMDSSKDSKEELMVSEQGGRVLASGRKMRDAYQWFRAKGRVVNVNYRDGEK
ncbi:hypothetical protein ACHAPT_013657, partial [Fusarium lateritium]